MNEMHIAYKIRQHLNRGLQEISPPTADRLAAARARALGRQKVAVRQSLLATAGSFVQHHFENLHYKQILAGVALLIGIGCYSYWQAEQNVAELEAIDSALLADDLPVAALTDKGFDAWLKNSREE